MGKSLKDFYDLLSTDSSVVEELQRRGKAFEGDKENELLVINEVIIPFAKEKGYEFTYEDIRAYSREILSDDELDAVSGATLVPFVKCRCMIGGNANGPLFGR